MANTQPSLLKDLKSSGKVILGIIAFTSAVSTVLIEIFKFDVQWTVGITLAVTVLIVCSVLFMSRMEYRSDMELKEHILESKKTFDSIAESLQCLRHLTSEVRRDTLRMQLRSYIKDEPDNIDTILTIANEYFGKYRGNWIAHHEFLAWAERHKVHVPKNIMDSINGNISDHE